MNKTFTATVVLPNGKKIVDHGVDQFMAFGFISSGAPDSHEQYLRIQNFKESGVFFKNVNGFVLHIS